MEEIIVNEDGTIDLREQCEDEISMYDSEYPVKILTNGLKAYLSEAQEAAAEVMKVAVKASKGVALASDALNKGTRYIVDGSKATMKALEEGKVKFETTKSGKMTAQLRMPDGKYGEKVPIKKESFRKGVDPSQLVDALQMQALQDQLQTMTNQLCLIDRNVHDVLQGQQDDRIALYYSGAALYIESCEIGDDSMRQAMVAQAIRALSDASFQLKQTMKSDIKYLSDKQYESAKGKKTQLIDERMTSINKGFEIIHQATLLKAGIYCKEKQPMAMVRVLEEYSSFINDTIKVNAGRLAQLDVADNGTDKGVWKVRGNLQLDVKNLKAQLKEETKSFYISIDEGENKND